MSRTALERFKAKCRVEGECLVWTGATYPSGPKRSPGFWFEGKRWPARRWFATHIAGAEVKEWHNVEQTCANPLCVKHFRVDDPGVGRNIVRQNYLLNAMFPEGW